MMDNPQLDVDIAPAITKSASKQTYYTIRFLVDRERVADAYRTYAYFRWVDDTLDATQKNRITPEEEAQRRSAFLERQKSLLETCYRGEPVGDALAEEQMLVELVRHDTEKDSGLECYLRNMMAVMAFDAERRGKIISQHELSEYTHLLASAVTEAMHYFIGHCCFSPRDESRYLAVSAAHITHMLRDTYDDLQTGYYNIPRDVLDGNAITVGDIRSQAYRTWVQSRVRLARAYFKAGREYLKRVENWRCRLAGYLYAARFEWLLDTIEKEGYSLRPQYEERKSLMTGLRMGIAALASLAHLRGNGAVSHARRSPNAQ